jgi:peptidoglycan-associated lipoprotein
LLATAITLLVGAACRHAKPEPSASPAVPSDAPPPVASAPSATDPAQDAPRASDSSPGAAAEAERRAHARALLEQVVYFDFDRSDLDDVARNALDAKIGVLETDASYHLRIEGHADERGSDEYNLALGMRRANAVRRYLAYRGVSEGRLETVSLGEERPACTGSGEACLSRNRRAEFVVRP